MISTDLYWNPTRGWSLYGEFMIDDILRDDGLFDLTPEEGVPVRLAYQFGIRHVREGSRRLTLQAEYTRVYNYTYSVFYDRNFFHSDEPLGYPLGPDVLAAHSKAHRPRLVILQLDPQPKAQRLHDELGLGTGPESCEVAGTGPSGK